MECESPANGSHGTSSRRPALHAIESTSTGGRYASALSRAADGAERGTSDPRGSASDPEGPADRAEGSTGTSAGRNLFRVPGIPSAITHHNRAIGIGGLVSGAEATRLAEDERRTRNWKRWGPYLAERQWGTVREDYSEYGDVWNYFPHDHARSRAYRWGEDGLLGICDRQGRLCFALALWNERDPILKERLFGLTGPEGNHGEDVKEAYFYLDSTPTHSYLKALYKYPQAEFPYERLVQENRSRGKADAEFELADTGVFDDDRYFDVFAEYAKAETDDIL